jgi:hypothetical protein
LKGTGASIADAAGTANGSLAVAIANGQVSNLVDALAGLNGGKIIALMVGGDKDIALRCGGVAFSVRDGIGKSQLFVVDTEQTRVDGTGTFNLKDEQFNFTVTPKPKKPGILSLRTPLNLYGSFRHPQYAWTRANWCCVLALLLHLVSSVRLPQYCHSLKLVLVQIPTARKYSHRCRMHNGRRHLPRRDLPRLLTQSPASHQERGPLNNAQAKQRITEYRWASLSSPLKVTAFACAIHADSRRSRCIPHRDEKSAQSSRPMLPT